MKDVKNTIPVNKGNESLDTDERLELYDEYRSEGWEKEYKEYRKNWNEFPKNLYVPNYPLNVDLELAAVCNLKCPMCFLQYDDYNKIDSPPFISKELFKKVVDEMAENNVPALRLTFRGEPTLHPDFVELVKYAKIEKKIPEISMTTNGSKLSEDFIESIIDYVDWITISIDGLHEDYEAIRKPLKFNDTLQRIKNIKKIKEKHSKNKPVIRIQSVFPSIENNAEEYYNTFFPYVDLVGYVTLFDYDKDIKKKFDFEENFVCPQLYQRLLILTDGKAVLCCNDSNASTEVGDANEQTLSEIWNGKKLNNFRELQKQKDGFKSIELCKNCLYTRKVKNTKKIKINDRELLINASC